MVWIKAAEMRIDLIRSLSRFKTQQKILKLVERLFQEETRRILQDQLSQVQANLRVFHAQKFVLDRLLMESEGEREHLISDLDLAFFVISDEEKNASWNKFELDFDAANITLDSLGQLGGELSQLLPHLTIKTEVKQSLPPKLFLSITKDGKSLIGMVYTVGSSYILCDQREPDPEVCQALRKYLKGLGSSKVSSDDAKEDMVVRKSTRLESTKGSGLDSSKVPPDDAKEHMIMRKSTRLESTKGSGLDSSKVPPHEAKEDIVMRKSTRLESTVRKLMDLRCRQVLFNSPNKVEKMKREKKGKGTIPCKSCKKRFNSFVDLKLHVKYSHVGLQKGGKCPDCDRTFRDRSNFWTHLKIVHLGIKDRKCPRCHYSSSYSRSLRQHLKTKHTDIIKDEKDACKSKVGNQVKKGHIGKHTEMVIKDEKGHCKRSKVGNQVKRGHVGKQRDVSPKKIETVGGKCPHCSFQTKDRSNLRHHVKAVHLRIKDHQCPQCDYKSTYKKNLENHLKAVHLGIKDHQCPECDFRSSDARNVMQHLKARHLGIKDHQCSQCDYKSTDKRKLQNHLKAIHLGIKDHQCPECKYRSSDATNLMRHLKRNHVAIKDKTCPECDYRSFDKRSVESHIKKTHLKDRSSSNGKDKLQQLGHNVQDYNNNGQKKNKDNDQDCNNNEDDDQQLKHNVQDYNNNDKEQKENQDKGQDCNNNEEDDKEQKEKKDNDEDCNNNEEDDAPEAEQELDRKPGVKRSNLEENLEFTRHDLRSLQHEDYSSNSKRGVQSHVRVKNSQMEDSQCLHCKYRSPRPGLMKRHVQVQHLGVKGHGCPQCNYRSYFSGNVRSHVKAMHAK